MKLFRDLTGDDDSTADGHDEAADERECPLLVRHVVHFLEEEEPADDGEDIERGVLNGQGESRLVTLEDNFEPIARRDGRRDAHAHRNVQRPVMASRQSPLIHCDAAHEHRRVRLHANVRKRLIESQRARVHEHHRHGEAEGRPRVQPKWQRARRCSTSLLSGLQPWHRVGPLDDQNEPEAEQDDEDDEGEVEAAKRRRSHEECLHVCCAE